MAKKVIIKCPHCGCEYLPAEIYLPNSLLGHPSNIIKDHDGQILGFDGTDMCLTETYTCDKCNTTFNVDCVVFFKTEPVKDVFGSEVFKSKASK